MTTSQNTPLSKPKKGNRIPNTDLVYMRTRNKNRMHSLVVQEFVASGITQADLARRLGKKPEVVSRWLGAPGNWRLDTISDLLFAMSGGEAEYSIAYPLERAPRNDRLPHWLIPEDNFEPPVATKTKTKSSKIILAPAE